MGEAALIYEPEQTNRWAIVLRNEDGTEERLPARTPAEDLIEAVEIDYSGYRREIERLWNEHPLFEERPVIRVKEPCSTEGVSEADYEDFSKKALALPELLREIDPLSYFCMREILRREFHFQDDGSAEALLNAGAQTLKFLWEPILVQVYLRNIFEMTFDGMERATQAQRFRKLCDIYPDIGRVCDPQQIPPAEDGRWVFPSHHLFKLRMLELALYFKQSAQRIARCEYCWGYFIPKTKSVTRYCDRATDGFRCKDRGARFKRNERREQDEALRIYKLLCDRVYARYRRYIDAAPWDRGRLIPMDDAQYDAWSKNASAAHQEYAAKKITAEEFLRRVDTTHELTSYETTKAELVAETAWQRRVAHDIGFDPLTSYPEEFMVLDLGKQEPKWETHTGDDLRRHQQKGHQSLREKYGKDK